MEYTVHGTREGTRFSAPVEAESEEEAREQFLDDVDDPTEFDIDHVEHDV